MISQGAVLDIARDARSMSRIAIGVPRPCPFEP